MFFAAILGYIGYRLDRLTNNVLGLVLMGLSLVVVLLVTLRWLSHYLTKGNVERQLDHQNERLNLFRHHIPVKELLGESLDNRLTQHIGSRNLRLCRHCGYQIRHIKTV